MRNRTIAAASAAAMPREAALRALMGFTQGGRPAESDVDACAIPLTGFEVPSAKPITQADMDAGEELRGAGMARKLPSVDVVFVGFGWTAAILAQELTDVGLQCLALERGGWRDTPTVPY